MPRTSTPRTTLTAISRPRPRLFTGGTLVEFGARRVRRADLLVEGERIREVREPRATATRPRGVEVIRCEGKVVMPGLALGHTHLYSALARGMPPPSVAPRDFAQILERVWWRLDRALDAEAVSLSVAVGAIEAARAGVTTIFDHHASPFVTRGSLDLVAAAVEEVGVRGVLCYETSDRGGRDEAKRGLVENDRFLTSLRERPRPLLRGMVGAHAGFTLGHDTTVALADLAVRHGVGVHIHVAEDAIDAHHFVPAREATAVEWLASYRLLGPHALLAHGVHIDDEGARRVVASGAQVAHNARSNMNNRVGYARPGRFGDRVVLGTDGLGANLFAEAQAAFLAAREHDHAFDPVMALARGQSLAAAVFDAGLGRLEPGCPADLTLLDYDPPTPLEAENLFGHVVFGMSAAHVCHTVVRGRDVLRDRRLVNVDEAKVMARARVAARALWERMAAL